MKKLILVSIFLNIVLLKFCESSVNHHSRANKHFKKFKHIEETAKSEESKDDTDYHERFWRGETLVLSDKVKEEVKQTIATTGTNQRYVWSLKLETFHNTQ